MQESRLALIRLWERSLWHLRAGQAGQAGQASLHPAERSVLDRSIPEVMKWNNITKGKRHEREYEGRTGEERTT